MCIWHGTLNMMQFLCIDTVSFIQGPPNALQKQLNIIIPILPLGKETKQGDKAIYLRAYNQLVTELGVEPCSPHSQFPVLTTRRIVSHISIEIIEYF